MIGSPPLKRYQAPPAFALLRARRERPCRRRVAEQRDELVPM